MGGRSERRDSEPVSSVDRRTYDACMLVLPAWVCGVGRVVRVVVEGERGSGDVDERPVGR